LACWRVGVLVLGCWGRADLRLPASSGAEEARRDGQEPQEGKDLSLDQYPPLTEQLAPELITFSTVPAPRWQASTSLPSSSRICLLALVLVHLPPCPRPRVPLHSSIPQSSVADGLRGSTLVEASASIWKHLEASGSIWKRAASSLARAHSSAHSSLAGL
jgi:hypothetical protein